MNKIILSYFYSKKPSPLHGVGELRHQKQCLWGFGVPPNVCKHPAPMAPVVPLIPQKRTFSGLIFSKFDPIPSPHIVCTPHWNVHVGFKAEMPDRPPASTFPHSTSLNGSCNRFFQDNLLEENHTTIQRQSGRPSPYPCSQWGGITQSRCQWSEVTFTLLLRKS